MSTEVHHSDMHQSDTSICRCWYNAWLVGNNLTVSIIHPGNYDSVMLRYLTNTDRILSIFSNYFIFYSVSSCSMVLVLTSDTGQSSVLCTTTHIRMTSHRTEFRNTSVNFCGEGKGESCERSKLCWRQEFHGCQKLSHVRMSRGYWISQVTNPVMEGVKKRPYIIFSVGKNCD